MYIANVLLWGLSIPTSVISAHYIPMHSSHTLMHTHTLTPHPAPQLPSVPE